MIFFVVLTIFKQIMKWPMISRCNARQLERITQLEHNNLDNAQYSRRETLEINPLPSDVANYFLEQSVC